MAKGSSESAPNLKELPLACRDKGLLVGLDRHLRSSKKRSTEGDLSGLMSMNVLRTIESENEETLLMSMQTGVASTWLGVLTWPSRPSAATGVPPLYEL